MLRISILVLEFLNNINLFMGRRRGNTNRALDSYGLIDSREGTIISAYPGRKRAPAGCSRVGQTLLSGGECRSTCGKRNEEEEIFSQVCWCYCFGKIYRACSHSFEMPYPLKEPSRRQGEKRELHFGRLYAFDSSSLLPTLAYPFLEAFSFI